MKIYSQNFHFPLISRSISVLINLEIERAFLLLFFFQTSTSNSCSFHQRLEPHCGQYRAELLNTPPQSPHRTAVATGTRPTAVGLTELYSLLLY